MFRKYYKEANDNIKASEEFLNSVIEKTHRQPVSSPVHKYYKYTASIAAAVVVISAAVVSMPFLSDTHDDGVIESITETASPQSDEALPQDNGVQTPNPDLSGNTEAVSSPPENTSDHSYTENKNTYSSENAQPIFNNPAVMSESRAENQVQKPPAEDSGESEADEAVSENSQTTESGAVLKKNPLMQIVEDSSAVNPRPTVSPSDRIDVFYAPVSGTADTETEETVDIGTFYDSDVPVPQGYHCTRAAWNGYTFTSEDGAVITVEISYGGEDSEPYYSIDGDSIFASFGAHNMTVIINSTGADISIIEEIINSLR